jgi:hypothetical protein
LPDKFLALVGPVVHGTFAVGLMCPTDDGHTASVNELVVVFGVN